MSGKTPAPVDLEKSESSDPEVLEEIVIEELSVDGICGVY